MTIRLLYTAVSTTIIAHIVIMARSYALWSNRLCNRYKQTVMQAISCLGQEPLYLTRVGCHKLTVDRTLFYAFSRIFLSFLFHQMLAR
ncbi:Uncharacterized protein HZ326_31284 [Fusarium oxysporum f. sp. albedinis]|nr:Uncharacterized protein HZ326_31284 [Fusarium oxysporum f. sp. albedinis]